MERLYWVLGFWGDYNKDILIPNSMGTSGPAGTERAEGQVTAEDSHANGWVLTNPNDPNPANTTALPVATTAAAVQQQQQAKTGNQGGVNSLPATKFLRIGQALHWLGYTMFDSATLEAELKLKWDIQGNSTKQTAFKDFAINYTQLRVYIAMIGDQKQLP
jgi:hypothetical protein